MAPSTRRGKPISKSKTAEDEISEEDKHPGVVYVGHVPHGFYEEEMKKYFSQFGDVLAVKLSRSKKSGKSKGYAFIKFRYAAVAKTVADTCHNYLFFNRLLKCSYRPLEEVHKDTFKAHPPVPVHKEKRIHNADKSDVSMRASNKKTMRKMKQKLKQLSQSGIDLKLDDVLNVPEIKTSKNHHTDEQEAKDTNTKKRKRGRMDENTDAPMDEAIGESKDKEIAAPTPKRRRKLSKKLTPNGEEKVKQAKVQSLKEKPVRKAQLTKDPSKNKKKSAKSSLPIKKSSQISGHKDRVQKPTRARKSNAGKRKK